MEELKGRKVHKIPNIEGYLITEYGEIFSLKTQKFMIPRVNSKGYLDINLSIKGKKVKNGVLVSFTKKVKFYIHKLVAITFLGNSTLPIRFKDNNKSNCHKDNLEYKQGEE